MTMTLEYAATVLTAALGLGDGQESDAWRIVLGHLAHQGEVVRTCRICGGQVDLSNSVKPDAMDTKGWHANARTVSDRYSSGSAQCKEPSQLINADLTSPVREYEKVNVEANEFTRDGAASQP